jgi:putative ABC transport system permease protein
VSAQIGIGLLAGGVIAAGVARGLRAMFFHVPPDDPFTFIAIVVTLVLVAAGAAFVPVRRAIRVDPTVTLRTE